MRLARALALAAVASAVSVPAAQARDDSVHECSSIGADDVRVSDDSASSPLSLLGVEDAWSATGRGAPGAGLAVAVVDSGVSTASGLVTVSHAEPVVGGPVVDPHGTILAGLIAGHPRPDGRPVGIAPGARIVDVKVYDTDPPGDGQQGIREENVAAGLRWVADHARTLGIKVVDVSLAVPRTRGLAEAVRSVWKADVLLVAASGNRPQEETDLLYPRFNPEDGSEVGPGEDAAADVFPAGYPHVLAVSATTAGLPQADEVKTYVLANRATDLAAPTYDGVSVALNGSTCRVQQVATSFAAAEVSGVAALLRARYPDDTVDQTIARLVSTADGTVDDPTPYQGAGIVQPLEALTRPLHPDRSGSVDRSTSEEGGNSRATAPEPRADLVAATRRDAVWWGLLGGGALLLALLLGPVLARRRGE